MEFGCFESAHSALSCELWAVGTQSFGFRNLCRLFRMPLPACRRNFLARLFSFEATCHCRSSIPWRFNRASSGLVGGPEYILFWTVWYRMVICRDRCCSAMMKLNLPACTLVAWGLQCHHFVMIGFNYIQCFGSSSHELLPNISFNCTSLLMGVHGTLSCVR